MYIKSILDEIKQESSTNQKMVLLSKHKSNELLKNVLYLALSKRIKFFIKQIPEYVCNGTNTPLGESIKKLNFLIDRTYTGNEASMFLASLLSNSSVADAEVLEKIISKDLEIGMGSTNVNKVFKGLIEKTPYMGAKPYSKDLVKKLFTKGSLAYSQLKMDGRYCNAIIHGGEIELVSRNGEPTVLTGARILKDLEKIGSDIVLNGELTMASIPERKTANGIITSIIDIISKENTRSVQDTIKKKMDLINKYNFDSFQHILDSIEFTVWDCITVNEYYDNFSKVPYRDRLVKLQNILSFYDIDSIKQVETKIVSSPTEAMQHFAELLRQGHEGTVLKAIDGPWKDGKPNHQVKFKQELNLDLRITGFNWGTGKNEGWISSLKCATDDGILNTDPAGLSEADMEYITNNMDSLLGSIVEIKCSGLSEDSAGNKSVLHPVYLEIRTDKTTANTWPEVLEINKASIGI